MTASQPLFCSNVNQSLTTRVGPYITLLGSFIFLKKKMKFHLQFPPSLDKICNGEMAERSIAAVLKTVEGKPSQGSNPCLSAKTLLTHHKTHIIVPPYIGINYRTKPWHGSVY